MTARSSMSRSLRAAGSYSCVARVMRCGRPMAAGLVGCGARTGRRSLPPAKEHSRTRRASEVCRCRRRMRRRAGARRRHPGVKELDRQLALLRHRSRNTGHALEGQQCARRRRSFAKDELFLRSRVWRAVASASPSRCWPSTRSTGELLRDVLMPLRRRVGRACPDAGRNPRE